MVFIYALCDPETHEVRYIGKANNIERRLKGHRNDKTETRKVRWLQSLQKRGIEPEMLILAEVHEDDWQEAEQHWIAHYRSLGANLTNHTDGGEGLHNPTDDTRAKISAIQRALHNNPEYQERIRQTHRSPIRRTRISEALRGRKKTPDHIAKLPQNQPGRELTVEHRKKISDALQGNQLAKGFRHTSETRDKISRKLIGNQHTRDRVMPEHEKRSRSNTLRGRPKTQEHKERIKQSAIRR